MKIRKVTFDEVVRLTERIATFVQNKGIKVEVILAPLYGAGIPATLIARILDVTRIEMFRTIRYEAVHLKRVKGNVLLVEDIVDSGWTIQQIHQIQGKIPTVALFRKLSANPQPMYSPVCIGEDYWVAFPWEKEELCP